MYTSFNESASGCTMGDCEANFCIPASGTVTVGSLCSGLIPSSDGVFSSAPQSTIGTAADVTMSWVENTLSSSIFSP